MTSRATLQALAALLVAAVQINATPVAAPHSPNLVLRDEPACPAEPLALTDDRFGNITGGLAASMDEQNQIYPLAKWLSVGGSYVNDVLLDTGSSQLWVYDDQVVSGTPGIEMTKDTFKSAYMSASMSVTGLVYKALIKIVRLDLSYQRIGFVSANDRKAGPWNGIMGLGFPVTSPDDDLTDTSLITGLPFFTVAGGEQKGKPITLWNFDHIEEDKIDRTKFVSVPVTPAAARGPRDLSAWTVNVASINVDGETIPVDGDKGMTILLDTAQPGSKLPAKMVEKVFERFKAKGGRFDKPNGASQYWIHKDDAEKWADIDLIFGSGKKWTQFGKTSFAFMSPQYQGDLIISPLQPTAEGTDNILGGAFIRGNLVAFDSQGAKATRKGVEGCAAIRVAPLLKGDDLNLPS